VIRCIQYRAGYKYQLVQTYIHKLPFPAPVVALDHEFLAISSDGYLMIKWGYAWDGPSGPTVDTPDSMRGALVHDAGYQLMRDGYLDRDIFKPLFDRLLVSLCAEDGMGPIRRWFWYQAVEDFAFSATQPRLNDVLTAP